ncbi:hypothetical protein LTR85_007173 [Meristemomyces frigidus]|nr:hypothetical protein LTR85_007173 [Meristemomyces frigidus]
MQLPFARLSSLLSQLEDIEVRDPPLLQVHKLEATKAVTARWFRSNRAAITELDVPGAVALLSTFLPERRTDRVYGIQAPTLCRVLSRGLNLSASRTKDLQAWREPSRGDLAACVERVLRAGGPPAAPPVVLSEVDDMLMALAGQCRFSGPAIISRIPPGSSEARDKLVGDIFKRLTAEEGKWLVRLILKNLAPVLVDEKLIIRSFHFLLPDLLRFQNDFEAALTLLKGPLLRGYPELPDRRSEALHRQSAAGALRPVVGVKVGRPAFHKAWSIDLCLKMAGSQEWVLERKYDGEYCEVHIDLSRSPNPAKCIKIFSKSGKESTQDRRGLHQTLVQSLRLGEADCKIERQAILLGELVVYSDKDRCILPFDKIRKHVWRSGVFLGNEQDSQAHAHEHLAIVFFDLLLLDDEVVMTRPVEERRVWLRELYTKMRGRAMGAEWKIVDFGDPGRAKKLLVQQFAASIAQRCEGLVLKPCGVPYFSLDPNPSGQMRSYVKLKKDYMAGLGDDADFAVIGASYNAQQALRCGISGIKWTNFHLGCLVNAAEAQRFDARPVYKLVHTIQQEACIPKPILQSLNTLGARSARPYDPTSAPFSLQVANYVKIDVVFDTPLVLEVLGSGYDKPASCGFYMLRHARVKKLHQDRSWKDCVSFQELQERAAAARDQPAESESQETRKWLEKLTSRLKSRLESEGTITPRSRRTATPTTTESAFMTASRQADVATRTSPPSSRLRSRTQCVRQPTKCDRGKLNGRTLAEGQPANTNGLHGHPAETPCPPRKRRRIGDVERASSSDPKRVRRASVCGEKNVAPLADITNQALGRSPLRRQLAGRQEKPVHSASRRYCPGLRKQSRVPPHECGAGSACAFANSVIYLAPCIATTPNITEDLLPNHSAVITSELLHWDRDSDAHPAMRDTVSESQAYPDMRKIILVEAKRVQVVQDVLQQVVGLNNGRLKERIDVYDWRVLEECSGHDKGPEAVKEHFVGATMFDDTEMRRIFVSAIPDLCV